jgi:hypothetical protein
MKKIIFLVALSLSSLTFQSQILTPQPSPKCIFNQMVGLTDVEVEYSRPGVKGRNVFGDLVPFGKVWRTGANSNTTISFSEDVLIDGKTLKKGKYALYTTPKADSWDIIFYKDDVTIGKLGCIAIPQIPASFVESLRKIFTYPFSPQLEPQLFLTNQYLLPFSSPYPTTRTP